MAQRHQYRNRQPQPTARNQHGPHTRQSAAAKFRARIELRIQSAEAKAQKNSYRAPRDDPQQPHGYLVAANWLLGHLSLLVSQSPQSPAPSTPIHRPIESRSFPTPAAAASK